MESASRLSSEYIAVEFNGSEKKLLNTLESVETSYPGSEYIPVEARYLTSEELETNERKTYTIKLWMDESVTVEDDAMNKSFISKIVVTAKQSHKVRLVDYIMSETSKDFEVFEHPATYQTKALTDYRYTGSNPNNYVCFGSEEVPCPEDNLYRIIGVIPTQSEIGGEYENRVKLVKATPYEEQESGLLKNNKGYQWNNTHNNKWEDSSLNTKVLNKIYWSSLREYQKYVVSGVWYLGAPNYTAYTRYTPEDFYKEERSNTQCYSKGVLAYINNIGLMYPSDYAYSIGNSYKNNKIYDNPLIYTNSWLELKDFSIESTLSTEAVGDIPTTWYHFEGGRILGSHVFNENNIAIIRPVFYLKTTVSYKSGLGTKESPIRIGMNE